MVLEQGINSIKDYETELYETHVGKVDTFLVRENVKLSNMTGKDRSALFACPSNKQGICKLPENTNTIKTNALYNCKKIDTLIIPAAMQTIEENALLNTKIKMLRSIASKFHLGLRTTTNSETSS